MKAYVRGTKDDGPRFLVDIAMSEIADWVAEAQSWQLDLGTDDEFERLVPVLTLDNGEFAIVLHGLDS